jgi:restriction system protein
MSTWRRRQSGSSGGMLFLGLLAVGGICTYVQQNQINIGPLLIGGVPLCLAVMLLIWLFRWNRRKGYRNALLAFGARTPLQLNPVDYERFCALLLQQKGWKTRDTRVTGDFGGDIVARRGKVKIVVQCKRYSSPVGVKAVQEVHAAKAYYQADKTAVMTPIGFTKAARELAAKTQTQLIVVGRDSLSLL